MRHRKYSNFLILAFVAVSIYGVYSYFYNDLKSEASTDGALTSSLDNNKASGTDTTPSGKASEDIAFLRNLASLSKIKIDSSLLSSQEFKLLVDNNIKLERPLTYGRVNPFAPTENVTTNAKPVVSVRTLPATAITNNSALLNGIIEGVNSNTIYFEYGVTENLGKITEKLTPSLVGNLTAKLIGLPSKAKIFYRATANVNGTMITGNILSFTTN